MPNRGSEPCIPPPIPRFYATSQKTRSWGDTGRAQWGLKAASLMVVSPHRLSGGGLVPRPGAAVQTGHP